MADDAKDQAADPSAAPEEAKPSADSGSDSTSGTNDSGQTDAKAAGQADDSKKPEEGKADDAGAGDKKPEPKEFKPQSRRSAEYRIKQLADENRRLKAGKTEDKPADADKPDEEQPDDAPKNPADVQAIVAAAVAKALKPYETTHTKAADDAELKELFAGKTAEQTKYEPQIRKMWDMAQYKDLSAVDVLKIVSFDEAVAQATTAAIETYKKAQRDAKDSSTGGTSNSNRSGKSGKSVTDLSDAEFLARNERIKANLPVD